MRAAKPRLLQFGRRRDGKETDCADWWRVLSVGARIPSLTMHPPSLTALFPSLRTGKGGKNRRRGKNEGDEKRELITKEEGQGAWWAWGAACLAHAEGQVTAYLICMRCWWWASMTDFSQTVSLPHVCLRRVRKGDKNAWQWTLRGVLLRRQGAAVPHSREDAQEGVGGLWRHHPGLPA